MTKRDYQELALLFFYFVSSSLLILTKNFKFEWIIMVITAFTFIAIMKGGNKK